MSAVLAPPVVRVPQPAATAVPVPPAVPPTPTPRLWSRKQFESLHGQGFFEGRRAFLLRGVILEEGTMDPPHATGVTLVHQWLSRVAAAGQYPRTQLPLDLGADTEPLPDVALVRGSARDYTVDHPTAAHTLLVVEVADSSQHFDLTTKAELYAEAGIVEYWVLDVLNKRLTVLTSPTTLPPGGYAYLSTATYQPTDSVAPLAAPTSPVLVSDLLP